MKTDAKVVLIRATALFSIIAIGVAAKSPDLTDSLMRFDSDNVMDADSFVFRRDRSMLDDGPTTMLSRAIAKPEYSAEVQAIIDANEAAIIENLEPFVTETRRRLGLKD